MARPGRRGEDPPNESLGILLLPSELEAFELEAHARDLLSIPRVIALEPSRLRAPRFLQNAASLRQGRRLRFPGRPRLLVLYHPAQYPLARALLTNYEELELWYIPPAGEALDAASENEKGDLLEFDELARGHAAQTLSVVGQAEVDDTALRQRLGDLDVINPRAFVPGVQSRRR
jgi:hypothetical protein